VRGLLLVCRRCVAVADISGQFSQMWSDAVISHTGLWFYFAEVLHSSRYFMHSTSIFHIPHFCIVHVPILCKMCNSRPIIASRKRHFVVYWALSRCFRRSVNSTSRSELVLRPIRSVIWTRQKNDRVRSAVWVQNVENIGTASSGPVSFSFISDRRWTWLNTMTKINTSYLPDWLSSQYRLGT